MTRRGEKAGAGRGRHRAVWLVIGRLAQVTLRRYIGGGLLWVAFFVIPLVTGLVLQALFDAISGQRAVSLDPRPRLSAAQQSSGVHAQPRRARHLVSKIIYIKEL
jgi:ATP-binding cassette, subfamily B, bacterial